MNDSKVNFSFIQKCTKCPNIFFYKSQYYQVDMTMSIFCILLFLITSLQFSTSFPLHGQQTLHTESFKPDPKCIDK